jgi:hypothetical protein
MITSGEDTLLPGHSEEQAGRFCLVPVPLRTTGFPCTHSQTDLCCGNLVQGLAAVIWTIQTDSGTVESDRHLNCAALECSDLPHSFPLISLLAKHFHQKRTTGLNLALRGQTNARTGRAFEKRSTEELNEI